MTKVSHAVAGGRRQGGRQRTEDAMPRPILGNRPGLQLTGELSLDGREAGRTSAHTMSKPEMDRLLRKPRSAAYMDAMRKLDIGSHTHHDELKDEIIRIIRDEFPEVQLEGILIGVIAKCYIGPEYDVHSIGLDGGIIHHYKKDEPMNPELARARGLAARGTYEFIEVYHDCCRCISANGSVAIV